MHQPTPEDREAQHAIASATSSQSIPGPLNAGSAEGRSLVISSRRGFLMNTVVAVASIASAAAISAPSISQGADSAIHAEDPKLVELGERLGPLVEEFRSAASAYAAAIIKYDDLCPVVPDELVLSHEDRFTLGSCAAEETDLDGKRVYADKNLPVRQILIGRALRAHIILHDVSRHTKFGKRVRRLAKLATAYDAAKKAALRTSNFDALEVEYRHAAYELESLVWEMRKIEPVTFEGVLIYARALCAFERAEGAAGKIIGGSGQILGSGLAAAITRIAA